MIFRLRMSANIWPKCKADNFTRYEELGFKLEPRPKLSVFDDHFLDDHFDVISDNLEIDIVSIEELVEFVRKYGEIVFDEGSIEIYNYYRE